jgi:hypothetical protein
MKVRAISTSKAMMSDMRIQAARELAALRKLDLIDPLHVVHWATEQCAYDPSTRLLELAMLSPPVRAAEVDGLLERVLEDWGHAVPNEEEAGLIVARRVSREIVDGSLEPSVGARKIWWDVLVKVPSLHPRLGVFEGLASEWEDTNRYKAEYEQDIVEAAQRLLDEWVDYP